MTVQPGKANKVRKGMCRNIYKKDEVEKLKVLRRRKYSQKKTEEKKIRKTKKYAQKELKA